MVPLKFLEANVQLGKPQNWDEERNGECVSLPVYRDEDGSMTSLWKPSKEELDELNSGGAVYLKVLSENHPPISLGTIGAAGFTNGPNHPGVDVPQ